jgi:hypothetical protein
MYGKKLTLLFISLSLLFVGCKKSSELDPLSNVIFSKDGLIRVECADCSLNYSVLNHNFDVPVKNSTDIKFSYVSDFELKTSISANKKQNIRLVVFDAYGRIISNELTAVDQGVSKIDKFNIKIN